ncbi:MAG TPA: ABC transporter ATP-binding protein [Blastocatellia bacterium]|nr:ABC transporter ATP-binding protein [Blastocatellia bacterium]
MDEQFDVELIDVSRSFGEVAALDSVSLGVRRGEFLTLLGPSGCGKTTLLRMIAGFDRPTRGRVMLGGVDVTDQPPYRRDVTTVFQQYALFPHMNVFENVAFGLERKRISREEIRKRVRNALDMVRMNGFDERRPSELSGGQQQRVALARALVVEPRVLLLDEPLAALDLKLRKQMQLELKALQRRLGISFVFVTHDQEEALTMSDRVVVMNAGRIEQSGCAEEIYERPQTEFVASFIGISNIIEGTVVAVRDGVSVISLGRAEVKVHGIDARVGERVRIMIRPEKIVLSANASGLLGGRIEQGVYLGESTQWRVRTDAGQEVTVVEQNREPLTSIVSRIGQPVSLSWEPSSAILLRR